MPKKKSVWVVCEDGEIRSIHDTEEDAFKSLDGHTTFLNDGTADISNEVYNLAEDSDLRTLYNCYGGNDIEIRSAIDVWAYYNYNI